MILSHGGAYQTAAKVDVGRAQLVFATGYLAEVEYMVVGTYQIMTLLQFELLVNLPGVDQTVTAHQGLVIGNLRHHFLIVEAAQLNEAATANIVQP